MEFCNGNDNDTTYGSEYVKTIKKKDLCIRDLGYFKIIDLAKIESRDAYYLSRLKSNVNVYIKNPNPEYLKNGEIKKKSEYLKFDIKKIMNKMNPGDTKELGEVYIGNKKELKTRLVLYKLTDKQLQERRDKHRAKEIKKCKKYKEETKELLAVNMYITNIPEEIVPAEQVHELYSLRWQVGAPGQACTGQLVKVQSRIRDSNLVAREQYGAKAIC